MNRPEDNRCAECGPFYTDEGGNVACVNCSAIQEPLCAALKSLHDAGRCFGSPFCEFEHAIKEDKSMTRDEALRTVRTLIPANSARMDGLLPDDGSVYWLPHDATVELDGNFTADQLEAIAVYMRDNYDPTTE